MEEYKKIALQGRAALDQRWEKIKKAIAELNEDNPKIITDILNAVNSSDKTGQYVTALHKLSSQKAKIVVHLAEIALIEVMTRIMLEDKEKKSPE